MLRLTSSILFAGVLAMGAAACSDNAKTVDSGTGCTSHLGCPEAGMPALTDPEGGQVLFEYIYFDTELQTALGLPAGVTTANRVMAFFDDKMTPEDNPLPTAGQCNNLIATKGC